ncbi:hypothetical protein QQ045_012859 [Rhodiola kirilowii]
MDRVVERDSGVSVMAIKNMDINDNFFPGHLLKRPHMRVVLMMEAMAQLSGLVLLQSEPRDGASSKVLFLSRNWQSERFRFRKPLIENGIWTHGVWALS